MDYNGPIWVRGCYPRKERQRFIRISCLLPTLCSGTPCAPRSVWCVLLLVFCTLYSMAYVYSTVYCDYSTPCAVMHCRSVHTTLHVRNLLCLYSAVSCVLHMCSAVFVGSDASLPHLPSLDTNESVTKWGSFPPLQITTIVS